MVTVYTHPTERRAEEEREARGPETTFETERATATLSVGSLVSPCVCATLRGREMVRRKEGRKKRKTRKKKRKNEKR